MNNFVLMQVLLRVSKVHGNINITKIKFCEDGRLLIYHDGEILQVPKWYVEKYGE